MGPDIPHLAAIAESALTVGEVAVRHAAVQPADSRRKPRTGQGGHSVRCVWGVEPVDHLKVGDPQGRAPPVDGWQQVREAIAKRPLQVPSTCVGEQGRAGPGEAATRKARGCSCPRSPLRSIETRRQVVGVVVEVGVPWRGGSSEAVPLMGWAIA